MQLVWVCPLARMFTRVIRTAANIRGADVASVVLPTSEEGSRYTVVPGALTGSGQASVSTARATGWQVAPLCLLEGCLRPGRWD